MNIKNRKLLTGHIFHKECITPWIKKKNNCPNCRIDITYKNKKLSKEEIHKQSKKNKENIYFGKNMTVDLNLIKKLTIKKLKCLLDEFQIDYNKCLYKDDLHNLIFNDIFYLDKPTGFLKKFLKKHKVNTDDCLERKDLLKLVSSVQLIKRIY